MTGFVTAVNDVWSQRNSVIPVVKINVQSVVEGDVEERLAAVDKALSDKQMDFGSMINVVEIHYVFCNIYLVAE